MNGQRNSLQVPFPDEVLREIKREAHRQEMTAAALARRLMMKGAEVEGSRLFMGLFERRTNEATE